MTKIMAAVGPKPLVGLRRVARQTDVDNPGQSGQGSRIQTDELWRLPTRWRDRQPSGIAAPRGGVGSSGRPWDPSLIPTES